MTNLFKLLVNTYKRTHQHINSNQRFMSLHSLIPSSKRKEKTLHLVCSEISLQTLLLEQLLLPSKLKVLLQQTEEVQASGMIFVKFQEKLTMEMMDQLLMIFIISTNKISK
jgi:hypothetical protein